ncbi:MAG TPA: DUF4136 domain-containing protein [Steroidobacteraceae bacterium]|nr:DUF4136 domain-containing protein [Steroidobacteraceae bacterium]
MMIERPSRRRWTFRWGAAGRWLSLASLGLILGACASVRVGSDFDHSASFSGYHTYSWMERTHRGSRNPLVAQRARDAIQAELTRKGYTNVSEGGSADFVVDFTIGSRERMDVESYPAPYGAGYWGPGWWGPYWGSSVDVRQYREGTLSIDIFDGHSHRPVWHGWAKKELTRSDIERSEAPIRDAVEKVLSRFPPS